MTVNPKRCPQNHPCPAIKVCPAKAITQEGYGLPHIDQALCINCNKCVRFCPMGAFDAN